MACFYHSDSASCRLQPFMVFHLAGDKGISQADESRQILSAGTRTKSHCADGTAAGRKADCGTKFGSHQCGKALWRQGYRQHPQPTETILQRADLLQSQLECEGIVDTALRPV